MIPSPFPSELSPVDRAAFDAALRLLQKPRVPPAPTLTTASFQLGDGSTLASVTVTWSPVRKDIDYIVRWKKSADANYTYERAKTSPHVIRPVETNAALNVALAAEFSKSGARSGFTADVNITSAQDTAAPATPTGVTATLGAGNTSISVAWNANTETDLSYYQILRSTTAGAETNYARASVTTFVDTNVAAGTTYYYTIKAVDRAGNASAASAEVNKTIPFTGPFTISSPAQRYSAASAPGTLTSDTTATMTVPAGSVGKTLTIDLSVTLVALSGSPSLTFRLDGPSTAGTVTGAITGSGHVSLVVSNLAAGDLAASATYTVLWRDASATTSTWTYVMASTGNIS